jgi:uracil phosphoribosyltransferase
MPQSGMASEDVPVAPGGARVVSHPVVAHSLSKMREASTDASTFRRLLDEISELLAYEALGDLQTSTRLIDTPVAQGVAVPEITETVLIVPVLRAGLGMVPAVQRLVPLSEVAHVGLRRNEETLQSTVYLDKLPSDAGGRRVVVCDPMLATGGSLSLVCDLVAARHPREIVALCLIASAPGVARFTAAHPEVRLVCAAIDPELDERGYIIPGLGDAGDRLFGLSS